MDIFINRIALVFIMVLTFLCQPVVALTQYQTVYVDDLDKDFRYKVEGVDLFDRGQDLFKQDMERELNKASTFKSVKNYLEKVSFMVNFYDQTKLDHIGIYGASREQPVLGDRNKKWKELTEILNKYLKHWKSAEYLGEMYNDGRIASVSFNINCDEDGKIIVQALKFSESKERYKLDSSCFKIIEPISKYEDPFFDAIEILAQYRGGSKMLRSNLNALLKPSKTENTTIDYFTIDFVITRAKQLAFFNNATLSDDVETHVAEKMKLLSCNWHPAIQAGRSVNLILSYKFYYSYSLGENQIRENINILDIITQDVPLKTKIEKDF